MTQIDPIRPPSFREASPRSYRRRWPVWAIALSMAGMLTTGATLYGSLWWTRQQFAQTPPPPANVPLAATGVGALGYLEPKGEITQLSAPAFLEGARVEKLLIRQGDKVEVGQVLVILDSRERLQAAFQQSQTQVKIAQARLEQVKAGAKPGSVKAQASRFEQTQAELEGQIAAQKATIGSLNAQLQGERTAQTATLERIKAELINARSECVRYQSLYQDGAVSVQEKDRICLQQQTTQKRLQEAQAHLTQITNTFRNDIAKAEAELRRIVATLQRQIDEDRAMLDAVAQVRSVDVQVALAELEAARITVKKAQADLNLAYVRAPKRGQILKIHTWPGEIVSPEGIVELGQTDQMYVNAEVYESDISQVRVGQITTMTLDGVSTQLTGIVEDIGLQVAQQKILGTDITADTDARVINVKIRLNPQDSQRVAGLTNRQVNVVIDVTANQARQ